MGKGAHIGTWSKAVAFCIILIPGILLGQSKVKNAPPTPAFDANQRLEGQTLSFFVLGDWGSGVQAQRDVAKAMIDRYAKDGATAVLSTGDNIYEDGVKNITDPLWDTRFEQVYPASDLPIPFYAVLGNHDYNGNTDAQIEYKGARLKGGAHHWNMPGKYWSHVFHSGNKSLSLRVTGIDTQILVSGKKEDRERQLKWLDSTLAASGETWNVVIGHHPVYSNGHHGNTISLILQLKPLLEMRKVFAYFSGHDHDLQILKPTSGVHYVVSGAGGKSRDVDWRENTTFAATNHGFVWFQINTSDFLVQIVNASGDILFSSLLK